MNATRKKNVLGLVLLWIITASVVATMFVCYYTVVAPRPRPGQKTVRLEAAFAAETFVFEDILTEAGTVFELLTEQNKRLDLRFTFAEDDLYGPYITGLMGVGSDTEKNYYFTYTVNGEFATGISAQSIEDGDIIRFEYGSFNADGETELKGAGYGAGRMARKTLLYVFIAVAAALIAGLGLRTLLAVRKSKRGGGHEKD